MGGLVLSAVYGLRAVGRLFFGTPTEAFKRYEASQPNEIRDLTWSERLPAMILLGTLLLVGFWPSVTASWVNEALTATQPVLIVDSPNTDGDP